MPSFFLSLSCLSLLFYISQSWLHNYIKYLFLD
nr:MAG TPA: hypothetical protein [Caudoviricetes sp.]